MMDGYFIDPLRVSDPQEVNTSLHFLLRTEKQRRERRRMDEIKRIQMSLHLLLVLIPFTVLADQSSIIIRAGAEVTLSCDKMRDDHVNCGATEWLFTDSEVTRVNLFVNRKLDTSEISKSKADRLRLAANCSLVISEVTAEDAGLYDCLQPDQTTHPIENHQVYLSVVNVTEQKRSDEVTLSCSVSTCRSWFLTVKWLFMNKDVDENNKDLKTSQSDCSATVSFSKSHFVNNMKNYTLLTCKVKHRDTEEKFSFIPPSSEGKNEPAPGNNEKTPEWWLYLVPVVGFATIVILVVILIRWRRNKDTQMNADENRIFSVEETRGFDEPDSSLCEANSSVPVVSGNKTQTHKHTVDPAEDLAYASINHSPYSTGQIQGGDHAVTYSTVKAPSSSTGPSADPSSLYDTVTFKQ